MIIALDCGPAHQQNYWIFRFVSFKYLNEKINEGFSFITAHERYPSVVIIGDILRDAGPTPRSTIS